MSRCTDEAHRERKWLHTIAPDLSDLRQIGDNEVGVWLHCDACSTTLLLPPVERRPASLAVTL